MTGISGWNGSYGSMLGLEGHIRCLDLMMRAMSCAQLVQNDRFRGLFSPELPFLRGVERHVLGLQCHQSGCDFWLEWFGWINGTWGTFQMSRFGDGGPARCSMGPKPSLERVFFSLKSPVLRGVQRHVLGLQCNQRGCNF